MLSLWLSLVTEDSYRGSRAGSCKVTPGPDLVLLSVRSSPPPAVNTSGLVSGPVTALAIIHFVRGIDRSRAVHLFTTAEFTVRKIFRAHARGLQLAY